MILGHFINFAYFVPFLKCKNIENANLPMKMASNKNSQENKPALHFILHVAL